MDDIIDLLTPTVAEVDLTALRHNVRTLRDYAKGAALLGVVKADAYGHGAVRVASVLQAEGVRHFAVATLPEALMLREAGLSDSILIFAAPLPVFLPAYARHGFEVTVSSIGTAEAVVQTARHVGPLRVHVKVDTGMGRLGIVPDEVETVTRLLDAAPGVTLAGLWTHFATADEEGDTFAAEQFGRFKSAVDTVGDTYELIHTANSGALLKQPDLVAPFADRTLVRTGIALYGLGGSAWLTEGTDLLPIMRFTSRVVQVKTVGPGTTISYGRRWRAERTTRIATVGAGYADGYRRLLTNRAKVGIGGWSYPVAGTVCMDMFMVDLGDPEGRARDVTVGDEVVLFGPGGPSAFELAVWAETIPYEITCAVAHRVPRVYRDIETPTGSQ